MTYTTGLDAMALLNGGTEGGGHTNKFTSFKSGDTRIVKVINFGDFIAAQTYSVFKRVNTFSPEVPPKLSAGGYPTADLTPFDKAWKYHKDLSKSMGDEHSIEAGKYRIKPRFAIGFYDLETKENIVIDFSKTQAKDIVGVIKKFENRLGKKAFELEKTGTGTNTKLSFTPLDLEDLTEAQLDAFENSPKSFDKTLFENLYFVQNEQQMIESLQSVGFDPKLIGYEQFTAEAAPVEDVADEDDPTNQF